MTTSTIMWPKVDAAPALAAELRRQAARRHDGPRLTRTCLQDAIAGTRGDYFGASATMVERGRRRSAPRWPS